MPVLTTGDIALPRNIAAGMFTTASTGSAVTQLSGQQPMQFGDVDFMTFNVPPRAEYVGEGAQKSDSDVGFGVKTARPHKAQVTMRFNQEVRWADEDYQLGVLTTLADAGGTALARALDLGVFHGINPRTGTDVESIAAGDRIATTTNRVEVATNPSGEFEAAVGLVVENRYTASGVAFDPAHLWTVATARFPDQRRMYPDLGFGANVTTFEGLRVATSTTVSGRPEAADTGVRAIVGQWDLLRWGVQRQVPVEMIEYGDPDGQGDLKRSNQIALRLEVVYGWVVMDPLGFAVLETAGAGGGETP